MKSPDGGPVIVAGPLRLNLETHLAYMRGEELRLTPTEFRLLQALVERRDRTQSRRQLLERVWGVESPVSGPVRTRTVDMHIGRLRSKLGETGDLIQTIRGFGYRLKVPGDLP